MPGAAEATGWGLVAALVVTLLAALLVAALVGWALLAVVLWRSGAARPDLAAVVRLLPDVVRLIGRLARDRSLPRRVRLLLWLLVGYLASPVDLVPDVVPVLGALDDVLAVLLVLRAVVRAAGPPALQRHWPGTPEGMAALGAVVGLRPAGPR
ncbi:DUF1232 domain-containing protein [Aquipuribacter nitratireducens]|uniref:DUF1232 domain-containing protein n=1 Tax=Aquipuribacter nitratireducens TaxID=650104 RepID=A0ABW0GJ27_9MICO